VTDAGSSFSPTPGDEPGLVIERDVEYGRAGDVVLKLDTYRPQAPPAGLLPAVVRIHGGGWRIGSKGGPETLELEIKDAVKPGMANLALTLARRGYFAIDIDYRLVPAARFPAPVEDAKCAVRWLRENAKAYSIDPDRIGAVGASAGGHLALMLALTDEKAGLEGAGGQAGCSSRVQAAVSWFGPTDMTPEGHSDLFKETVEAFIGGPFEQNREKYRQASPISYVSRSAPAILLVHGEEDPAVAFRDSASLAERLKAAGADVTLIPVKHAGHDFRAKPSVPMAPTAGEIGAKTVEFLDRHLRAGIPQE
jgi:acetyl esterase/lipase